MILIILLINQKHDDTPAYHVFYDNFPLAADENAPVQVLYNKDGIQFLQLEKVFAFTEQESNYDLKPFEEIAGGYCNEIWDAVRWQYLFCKSGNAVLHGK